MDAALLGILIWSGCRCSATAPARSDGFADAESKTSFLHVHHCDLSRILVALLLMPVQAGSSAQHAVRCWRRSSIVARDVQQVWARHLLRVEDAKQPQWKRGLGLRALSQHVASRAKGLHQFSLLCPEFRLPFMFVFFAAELDAELDLGCADIAMVAVAAGDRPTRATN